VEKMNGVFSQKDTGKTEAISGKKDDKPSKKKKKTKKV